MSLQALTRNDRHFHFLSIYFILFLYILFFLNFEFKIFFVINIVIYCFFTISN
jgi:hypothetical protein